MIGSTPTALALDGISIELGRGDDRTSVLRVARVFSTALQFAEHAGAGIRSGKYDFGMRVQHLSNGGVHSPNPGINFLLVRLQYALE